MDKLVVIKPLLFSTTVLIVNDCVPRRSLPVSPWPVGYTKCRYIGTLFSLISREADSSRLPTSLRERTSVFRPVAYRVQIGFVAGEPERIDRDDPSVEETYATTMRAMRRRVLARSSSTPSISDRVQAAWRAGNMARLLAASRHPSRHDREHADREVDPLG